MFVNCSKFGEPQEHAVERVCIIKSDHIKDKSNTENVILSTAGKRKKKRLLNFQFRFAFPHPKHTIPEHVILNNAGIKNKQKTD